MTYHDLYKKTVEKLRLAGIENPEVDTRRLIENYYGLNLSSQILSGNKIANPDIHAAFNDAVRRRQNREPLQYILEKCEFWSLDFIVTPDVLIPRQETEFLLYYVLSVLSNSFNGGTVLDMCTGSGAIAVVLAAELQASHIVAVDKSIEALHVAQQNIFLNGKNKSIKLVCSDLFKGLRPIKKYKALISNPPYIADHDMDFLQPEVRDWEPDLALRSGALGLDVIRQIHHHAPFYILPEGWIFLEIGSEQGKAVYDLFTARKYGEGQYKNVDIIHDWSGRVRVLQAQIAN